jgi:hypothetical protein
MNFHELPINPIKALLFVNQALDRLRSVEVHRLWSPRPRLDRAGGRDGSFNGISMGFQWELMGFNIDF